MAEFVDDVPHWKVRLVAEGHSRGHLQYIVATAPTTHAQSKAARELLDEADQAQHQSAMTLGGRTLRWTIVAAIAAIVGAVLTAIALLLSANTAPPKATPAASTSSPPVSTPKSVSPAPAAASSTSTPPAATPAAATPLPKTP